jgi:hypothetical protein
MGDSRNDRLSGGHREGLSNQAGDNTRSEALGASRRAIAINVPVMVAIRCSPPSRSAA